MPRRPYSLLQQNHGRNRDRADQFPEWTPWIAMVGARIRRLRLRREWTLLTLSSRVEMRNRPAGYGAGYMSELERGRGSAPLHAYEAIANALEVPPWVLFGPDEIDKPFSDAEVVLLRTLQRLEIPPDEAMARIARADGGGPS